MYISTLCLEIIIMILENIFSVFDRRLMHARILFSDHSKLHHNARLQSQLKYSMDAIFSELTSPQKQPFSLLSSTGTLYFQMNLVLYL